MAPRVYWKGYLKLSLVTCPVTMMPATSDADKIRFHTLNAKTGNRIASQYVDAVTGKPVKDSDEVKGYPRSEDDYVMLEDDEIEAVALDSTRTIDIEKFVEADSVAWVWYDKPHYLMPGDEVGAEAFSVIRDAMQATGTVGISRLVMYRRERAVMLKPRGKGIVLWTLRYGDEVRDEAEYFGKLDTQTPAPSLMKMVTKLIGQKTGEWSPDMVSDPVQENLAEIIAAKKKARKKPAKKTKAEPEAERGNVVNIVDALKKSLAAERGK